MARSNITCTEGQWTKILTNVTTGFVRLPLKSGAFKFTYTLRDFGLAAPSNSDKTDGDLALPMFEDGRDIEIASSTGLDVYVWIENSDDDSTDTAKLILDI